MANSIIYQVFIYAQVCFGIPYFIPLVYFSISSELLWLCKVLRFWNGEQVFPIFFRIILVILNHFLCQNILGWWDVEDRDEGVMSEKKGREESLQIYAYSCYSYSKNQQCLWSQVFSKIRRTTCLNLLASLSLLCEVRHRVNIIFLFYFKS